MKVMLVNPPWYRFFGGEQVRFPLGPLYVAAVLEENGFDVVAYNADVEIGLGRFTEDIGNLWKHERYVRRLRDEKDRVWSEVRRAIEREKPDVVGITVMTPMRESAVKVAKIAKEVNEGTTVIVGGPHPTLCPEEMLKEDVVDFAVRGEGEITCLELMETIEDEKMGSNLEKIRGISYRKGNGIAHNQERDFIKNLDALPFPAKQRIIGFEKLSPEAFSSVMASRGCPYNCIFCASNRIWKRKVRYRSVGNVIEEIREIVEKYRIKHIIFEDDSFGLNKRYTRELCAEIIKAKLDIGWSCEARVDNIDETLVNEMKMAGCRVISIGVESGNQETLRKIKKGITVEQVRKAAQIIKRSGIRLYSFFIIGFPWEAEKEITDTIKFMKEIDPDNASLSIATPYPGTELYDICKREGLIQDGMPWASFYHQSPDMYLSRALSSEEKRRLVFMASKAFLEHNRKKRYELLLKPNYVIERIAESGFNIRTVAGMLRALFS